MIKAFSFWCSKLLNAISPAVYLPDIANLAICIFIKLIGKSILLNISSDSNNIVGAENAI
jgi:hypothetical protein